MLPVPIKNNARAVAAVMAKDLPKYFSPDEIHQILSKDLKDEKYPNYDSYKSWFLCLFLWHTGARATEAVRCRVKDIDLYGKTVRLVTLKGIKYKNKIRVVPVPGEFIAELGLWIAQNELKRDDLLFNFNRKTAYYHIHKACKYAGIEDERCHPHTFRHSFAVNCIIQGTPVTVLQEWLGHANIMNTLIYTKVLARDSRHFMDNIKW